MVPFMLNKNKFQKSHSGRRNVGISSKGTLSTTQPRKCPLHLSHNGNISPFKESSLDILAILRNLEVIFIEGILAQGNRAAPNHFVRDLSWLSDIIT